MAALSSVPFLFFFLVVVVVVDVAASFFASNTILFLSSDNFFPLVECQTYGIVHIVCMCCRQLDTSLILLVSPVKFMLTTNLSIDTHNFYEFTSSPHTDTSCDRLDTAPGVWQSVWWQTWNILPVILPSIRVHLWKWRNRGNHKTIVDLSIDRIFVRTSAHLLAFDTKEKHCVSGIASMSTGGSKQHQCHLMLTTNCFEVKSKFLLYRGHTDESKVCKWKIVHHRTTNNVFGIIRCGTRRLYWIWYTWKCV